MRNQKCYIYTRVSTSMQVDGFSLDAQKDKLKKYADYTDMIVAGEYSDEGKSGKNVEGRTDFVRMLKDIESQKDGIDFVLVFKLSRFGRNAADVLSSLQQMQDYGVNLICVEDGIDSSKDSGKLMISVLSAVAEIERENILVQTMEGRKQKAREGKWNGGFAPYGYKLVNGFLEIAEDEAEVIRVIYDKYIHTDMGTTKIARYLNDNGYVKKIRQNGTIPVFTQPFITEVLDNPIYHGKIAYGRRKNEKIVGKRNQYHVVKQDEFDIYDGVHDAIVTEEDYELAQKKRELQAYPREKKYSLEHAYVLTGLLKCPRCGANMYGNVNRKRSKKTGEVKDRFFYQCKHRRDINGTECSYKKSWKQETVDEAVASYILEIVKTPLFETAIREKISSRTDCEELEIEKSDLKKKLRQLTGTKDKAIQQMDTLNVTDKHYERKYRDHEKRLEKLYDQIESIEGQIGDIEEQILHFKQEKVSGDNAYQYLLHFEKIYDKMNDFERKEFLSTIIRKIEIFEEQRDDGKIIKSITFKFPVDGKPIGPDGSDGPEGENDGSSGYVGGNGWHKSGHDETVVLMSRVKD